MRRPSVKMCVDCENRNRIIGSTRCEMCIELADAFKRDEARRKVGQADCQTCVYRRDQVCAKNPPGPNGQPAIPGWCAQWIETPGRAIRGR